MDDARLQSLIAELDAAVPRDEARVKIRQYGGGPDECEMVANKPGYLRLGVEMLKAAYAPTLAGNQPDTIEVDVDYLLIEDDSDAILLNWFQRREPDVQPMSPYRTDWILIVMVAVMIAIFALIGVGAVTVVNWLRGV